MTSGTVAVADEVCCPAREPDSERPPALATLRHVPTVLDDIIEGVREDLAERRDTP